LRHRATYSSFTGSNKFLSSSSSLSLPSWSGGGGMRWWDALARSVHHINMCLSGERRVWCVMQIRYSKRTLAPPLSSSSSLSASPLSLLSATAIVRNNPKCCQWPHGNCHRRFQCLSLPPRLQRQTGGWWLAI